jgi:hypothetical protein
MKRFLFLTVMTILSGSVLAQPPGISLQPGEVYVPGSLRDQNGNPLPDSHLLPSSSTIKTPNFSNPYIGNTGFQNEGVYVDPQTGQVHIKIGRERITQSALDPNRDIVDPGSLRNVNRYERDQKGTLWLITGRQWTSFGVPHDDLQRRSVTIGPNGAVVDTRDRILKYEKGLPSTRYPQQRLPQQQRSSSGPLPQRFDQSPQPQSPQPSRGLLDEFK